MTQTKPQITAGRGFRIALVLSLMANLLVVGIVAGGWISGHRPHPMGMQMDLGEFDRALDGSDRRVIGERMRQTMGPMLGSMRDRTAAVVALGAALRADPFDRSAVEAIFQEQRDRSTRMMAAAHVALLDRIEQMDPARRAAFADRLMRELAAPVRSD